MWEDSEALVVDITVGPWARQSPIEEDVCFRNSRRHMREVLAYLKLDSGDVDCHSNVQQPKIWRQWSQKARS